MFFFVNLLLLAPLMHVAFSGPLPDTCDVFAPVMYLAPEPLHAVGKEHQTIPNASAIYVCRCLRICVGNYIRHSILHVSLHVDAYVKDLLGWPLKKIDSTYQSRVGNLQISRVHPFCQRLVHGGAHHMHMTSDFIPSFASRSWAMHGLLLV